MRLVPADSLDLDMLLELFNEAYSDYVVPLRLDRAGIEFLLDVIDADLPASRVALADGRAVSFALLARRGEEGWIGGMGTVPSHRRRGIGEAALSAVVDEARSLGLRRIRLEVIESNTAARLLYEKLGFERVRDLVIWMLETVPSGPTGARPAEPEDVRAWIAAERRSLEPWQRADESLEHVRARGGELEGLAVDRDGTRAGAVLYQVGVALPRVGQIGAADKEVPPSF